MSQLLSSLTPAGAMGGSSTAPFPVFYWTSAPEPHQIRRRVIMQKYGNKVCVCVWGGGVQGVGKLQRLVCATLGHEPWAGQNGCFLCQQPLA